MSLAAASTLPSGGEAFRMLGAVVVFVPAVLTIGGALAPRRFADRPLALCVGLAFALGGGFLILFCAFIAGLTMASAATLAAAAGVALAAARWRTARDTLGQPAVRELAVGWLLFVGWSLGLLALVRTYSGGGWVADWVEHWQRAVFFRDRERLATLFAAVYPLSARPPLANVLTAAWLRVTGTGFAGYQVFLTLFGSLILFPVWTLATMWSKTPRAGRWAVVMLMLCPLVAQNVTFAWTKLPSAFFVLTSFALLVHAARARSAETLPFAAMCLGFGLLTHYSAAAWILALGVAAGWTARRTFRDNAVRRRVALAALAFVLVVTPWFAWSVYQFGIHGTAEANSTAAAWAHQTPLQRVGGALANLLDTIVPFPLRSDVSLELIAQPSALGRLRDTAFSLYQLNLVFACGLAGLLVLTRGAMRARFRAATTPAARFLTAALPLVVLIGVWVHTPRDTWGLVHICLQPLALLGLAKVAALLADEPRLRVGWTAFAAIDVALGIALHFWLQSWPVPRGSSPAAVAANELLNRAAAANACDKLAFGFKFLPDVLAVSPLLIAMWLAVMYALALGRLRSMSL